MATAILINPFEVPPTTHDDDFLAAYEPVGEFMRARPGFVSSRLHRALRPDAQFRFVNVAEWESPSDLQAAVETPEFRELTRDFVPSYPALYEVVRQLAPTPA